MRNEGGNIWHQKYVQSDHPAQYIPYPPPGIDQWSGIPGGLGVDLNCHTKNDEGLPFIGLLGT